MPVKDYRSDLITRLKNSEYAALYLKTALEETLHDGDRDAFLLALRDVVEAKELTEKNHQISDILNQAINQDSLLRLDALTTIFN